MVQKILAGGQSVSEETWNASKKIYLDLNSVGHCEFWQRKAQAILFSSYYGMCVCVLFYSGFETSRLLQEDTRSTS